MLTEKTMHHWTDGDVRAAYPWKLAVLLNRFEKLRDSLEGADIQKISEALSELDAPLENPASVVQKGENPYSVGMRFF